MYYRRKILLSLLENFDGQLNKTSLQKLLFIYTRWQEKKAFDFVPYKYGCYSFQANQDLKTLGKYGLVQESKNANSPQWVKSTDEDFTITLSKKDKALMVKLKSAYTEMSREELIKYTYRNYPYFAIKSEIAHQVLTKTELEKVEKQKRTFTETKLFSIGYEGKSLETYINHLIINDVKLLCDVRKNPLSMKYGFSKNQLKHACENVGIKYLHIPELGIISEKRQALNTLNDYQVLFKEYEKTVLVENKEHLLSINDLLKKYNRVALTCFEATECMCHRGRVVKALANQPNWNIPIQHL
ncbi:MAG: DUF488 family protein [Flavobacteriales bacterium]|nr:DUF488 family protein [Flavobacteriales bacterium]